MTTCSAARALTAVAVPASRRRRSVSSLVYLPSWRVSGVVRCCAGPGNVGISKKLAELWVAARSASPAAVLAAAAAVVVVYKMGSSLLAPPPPPPRRREEPSEVVPPAPEPVEVGEITADELRQYDGSDPEKPLLMAIKGQIYDVSQSRSHSLNPGGRLGGIRRWAPPQRRAEPFGGRLGGQAA
ncbi:hypothetical protein GUJ93_ZPchr0010g7415 [Zizania palustris]|uniref:Cytochrome b5 heme-binding domain-containing protein n=1 Tax=Zizania palustris TaxID=103762 RepID=A0A8J5W172_ZIZPA|nr:hypothetical protein GUJ93_ZPchr0010g7415 [Zizania palustris]